VERRAISSLPLLDQIDAIPWQRIALFVVCGLACSLIATRSMPYDWFSGPQDFYAFYFGAHYAGTPLLYDYQFVIANQAAVTGAKNYDIVLPYTRLPFYAVFFQPLAVLSYVHALLVWKVLSLCGLGAAAFLVDRSRKVGVLAIGMAVAAAQMLKYGQDTWIVLLLVCAFFRLLRCDRDLLAGLCVGAALALKPNLFLPLIVALGVAPQHRKLVLGAGASFAAAIVLCFLVQGLNWPADWLSVLSIENAKPNAKWMPTIAGIFAAGTGHARIVTPVAAVAVIGIGAWAGRRLPIEIASAVAIIAGLMGAAHSYYYDLLLVIPGCLIIARNGLSQWPLVLLSPAVQLFAAAGMVFVGPLLLVSAEAAAISITALAYRDRLSEPIHEIPSVKM
jgi:hypothetical protein